MNLTPDAIKANKPKDEDILMEVQAKLRQILQENREVEKKRKARICRLCEHGAIIEEFFSLTITMNTEQFAEFMLALAYGTGAYGKRKTRRAHRYIHCLRATYAVHPVGPVADFVRDGASPIPQVTIPLMDTPS